MGKSTNRQITKWRCKPFQKKIVNRKQLSIYEQLSDLKCVIEISKKKCDELPSYCKKTTW